MSNKYKQLKFGKFTIKGWTCIGYDCWRRNISDYTQPCKTFNHLEEGKKYIDNFLNKLVKIKTFL